MWKRENKVNKYAFIKNNIYVKIQEGCDVNDNS